MTSPPSKPGRPQHRRPRAGLCILLVLAASAASAACDVGTRLTSVDELIVSPGAYLLEPGDTVRLAVSAVMVGRRDLDDVPVQWTTSNDGVATVDGDGLVLAVGTGQARISASGGGATASAEISVRRPPSSCTDGGGTEHAGEIRADEHWRRVAGPHRITESIWVKGRLTIEPGTLVCAAPGAEILLTGDAEHRAHLAARGTADQPIVFTAEDPTDPWDGIRIKYQLDEPVQISNAVVEDATSGIRAENTTIIDSTIIRRIQGPGLVMWYYGGQFTNSVVDSAALSDDGTAVLIEDGIFRDNTIRNSGADGIHIRAGSAGQPMRELEGARVAPSAAKPRLWRFAVSNG